MIKIYGSRQYEQILEEEFYIDIFNIEGDRLDFTESFCCYLNLAWILGVLLML